MFRVPGSSSPPSTPNTRKSQSNLFPSTTPAGPPPTHLTNQSFTPAGPPPTSVFGSSYNAADNTFGTRAGNTPARKGFTLPESSPPLEDDMDADFSDDPTEEDHYSRSYQSSPRRSAFKSSVAPDSPRGLKRSRYGEPMSDSMRSSRVVRREPRESAMPAIAKGFTNKGQPAQLSEPDDLVLASERILSQLDDKMQSQQPDEEDSTLSMSASSLTKAWTSYTKTKTKDSAIGPADNSGLAKANYLASLLLQLHHPHALQSTHQSSSSRISRSNAIAIRQQSSVPASRALLDWLNEYHNPYPDDFNDVHLHEPSPSNHDRFWDSVFSNCLRGNFRNIIRLLSDGGFEHAITALDDGSDEPGFEGRQLENIEAVIRRCVRLLETCPAVKYDDFDVKGVDWSLFRSRVRQALAELESFAEGDSRDKDARENIFAQSARSSKGGMNLSTASRRAESKVPWSIYESLRTVYGLLRGGLDEIMLASQDWLEASTYLTVWWDGEDASFDPAASRLKKSGTGQTRQVDVSPMTAYRARLTEAFATVTDEPEDAVFAVDTQDAVQVGLASIMENDVEGAIGILRTMSAPVSTAIVELAAAGGWLPQARPRSREFMKGLSTEDLMVLSHGPGQKTPAGAIDRDEVLIEYADLLAEKNVFKKSDSRVEREGWELACSVLGRLDNAEAGQKKIGELLDRVQLDTEQSVDKVLALCGDLEMGAQGRRLAERFADNLTEAQSYGSALLYYARAHAAAKLKNSFDFLVSLCLIQSASCPAQSMLDPSLDELLNDQRQSLVRLAKIDAEAATLLSTHLSGYATLRKFYDLRDQESDNEGATKTILASKREAASALVAVINSAADPIHGGLFDPDVEAIVSPDSLLALLGETLPLLGQEKRIFTQQQVFSLLRIVEDFATSPPRIRTSAEELLKASISSFRGVDPSLKKTDSDMSGSSSWDMLNSETLKESLGEGDVDRGWDWRKGLEGIGGRDVGGEDMLKVLRTALAQEVARGWVGQIVW